MKASEYAEKFRQIEKERGIDEAVNDVFIEFFSEFKTISEQRKAQTDAAGIAIARELDAKWRALTRLVPELNPDGYSLFCWKRFPTLRSLFKHPNRI